MAPIVACSPMACCTASGSSPAPSIRLPVAICCCAWPNWRLAVLIAEQPVAKDIKDDSHHRTIAISVSSVSTIVVKYRALAS